MKKIILTMLILLFPTMFFGSISVNTYYLALDEQNKNAELSVINRSEDAKTYVVSFANLKQNSDGSYAESKESANFAGQYLVNTPKQFTLLPGQSQNIRVQRKAMAEAKDGEYTAHLLVQEKPDTKDTNYTPSKDSLKVSLQPVFSVSIPVVVRKGNLSSTTKIKNTKLVAKDGHIMLSGLVTNEGSKSVRGHFVLANGKTNIFTTQDVNVFLTSKSKNLDNEIIDADAIAKLNKLKGKKLIVKFVDYQTNKTLDSTEITY